MPTKYCKGCDKDHPLDEFAETKTGHRKHCRAFNNQREKGNKLAKIATEAYLNELLKKVRP